MNGPDPLDALDVKWPPLSPPLPPEQPRRSNGAVVAAPDETREVVTPPNADWPALPAEAAYHGLLGDIVRAVATETEADPVGVLGSLLAIFGSLARGHWFEQGDEQTANIYTCLVGESGTGRKGLAQNIGMRVFDLAAPDWHSIILPGLESGQALPRIVNDRYAAGTGDPRVLILEGELHRLLAAMARESSNVSTMLRDAWDGRPLGRSVVREKDSAVAHVHHIGLLGAITDTELRERLSKIEMANGFANRILWLAVRQPRVVPFPPRILDLVGDELVARLSDAIAAAKYGRRHGWDPDARDRWGDWYTNRAVGAGLSGALVARGPAQVIRLALNYALIDKAKEALTREHLDAAIALWEYSERSVVYIFGAGTGNPAADAILGMLPKVGDGAQWEVVKRELGIRAAEELDTAVVLLTRLHKVRLVQVRRSGGGRPRREIERVG